MGTQERLWAVAASVCAGLWVVCPAAGQEGAPEPESAPEAPASGGEAGGEEQAEADPEALAAELFERHILAIGGREALERITTRRITGTYKNADREYPVRLEIWQQAPNLYSLNLREPAGMDVYAVFDGELAWASGREGWAAVLQGVQAWDLEDSADFHGEANYQQRYVDLAYRGVIDFEGRPAHFVSGRDRFDRVRGFLFDPESGLLMAIRFPTLDEEGTVRNAEAKFLEYKEFDDLLFPTRLEQRFLGSRDLIEIRYQRVQHNIEVDPKRFRRPANLEIPEPADQKTGQ